MKPPKPGIAGPRLYCDLPLSPGAEIVLPDAAARHAVSVLRLQPGEMLTLFNGEGGEYSASLALVTKREARVRLTEFHAVERESPLTVTLARLPRSLRPTARARAAVLTIARTSSSV